MPTNTYLNPKKYLFLAVVIILSGASLLFGQGSSDEIADKLELSALDKQARDYRSEGLEQQRIGNIDGALSFYVKATQLDPDFAAPYNDIGIIYEARGLTKQAEDSYLKCLKVDPAYLSAYTNLALLYEGQRDLDKAASYWEKRARLGSSGDPWTQKAQQRLKDIRSVQSGSPAQEREQEVIGLMKDVANKKSLTKKDNRELAKELFKKAKVSYDKHNEVTALKQAIDAQSLDPTNEEVTSFIEKVQKRLLSK
jgi:tetratricopeptide (TPR) repeat protein